MATQNTVKFQKKGEQSMTLREFFAQFPSDEHCLQHVFNCRFGQGHECPKCKREAKWYRIKAERAYSCQHCGHHIHPTVDTPFENTRTPLQLWFFAIYLFTTTRNGVSAKELERQLGVTYKTAWRMGHEIRKHMAFVDGDDTLAGTVEVDETFIGGEGNREDMHKKAVVFGMLQRGGKVMAKVVNDRKAVSLLPVIEENVEAGSEIHSDQLQAYKRLPKLGFKHKSVNHMRKEYVRGNVHTNGIENFWKHLKQGIKSTHVAVSEDHLQKYVSEFECRFNFRHDPKAMFPALVSSFALAGASSTRQQA